jgi:site-specific DNA recombinase
MFGKLSPLTPKYPNGPLRVLMLGRVSTPGQPITNLEASYEYAQRVVKDVYKYDGPMEIKYLGEQCSGMKTERATIVEANDEIATGTWDVVLMEDLSKPYRNPRWQYAFVQDAHDFRTRLIAPGDNLDTGEENWEVALAIAVTRHGLFIPDVRRKVRRTATYSFHLGGMVTKYRFGYRKLSKEEAASGQYGPKSLRLAKLSECTPIILEMRCRVLADGPYVEIADWLNEKGVRAGPYVTDGKWSGRLVEDFLRDPILAGQRRFRNVLHEPVFKTGEHRRTKNAEPEVEVHPELAHMTPEEHADLIAYMDEIAAKHPSKSGPDHPLYNQPRSRSIWPAQHPRCLICGGLMHRQNPDNLRCKHVRARGGDACWNHVQVSCAETRRRVLAWMLDYCGEHPQFRQVLVSTAWSEFEVQRAQFARSHGSLGSEIAELERRQARLSRAIAGRDDNEALLSELDAVGSDLKKARRKREQRLREAPQCDRFTSREQVEENLGAAINDLAAMSFAFGRLMKRIIPEFGIQPVQALDCPFVRPRAKLTFTPSVLTEGQRDTGAPEFHVGDVCVILDLFEPPVHIQHLRACVAERKANPTAGLRDIADRLAINYMTVKRALDYARRMEAAGTNDPYVEVKERPSRVSRWIPRSKVKRAG